MIRLYSIPQDALDDDNDSESEESSEESSDDEENSEPENKGQLDSYVVCYSFKYVILIVYSTG